MTLSRPLKIITAFALLALTSCNNDVDVLFEAASNSINASSQSDAVLLPGFRGCVAATALDTSRIKVEFEFPTKATRMSIYRDGTLIASFSAATGVTTFTDSNLNQGQTYHYNCDALVDGVMRQGENVLTATTLLVDPPTFAGLLSAQAKNAHSVTLKWNPATGVVVDHYEVFAQVGSALSLTGATPAQRLPLGSIEATVSGLGDELPYVFYVRACSTETICDSNSVTKQITLADDGAPLTTGLASIEIANSQVVLNAPWKHSDGAVRKRHVYVSSSSNLSSFSLLKTVDVQTTSADLSHPPTAIPLTGLPENTQFYFLVRDEDPSGHLTTNTQVLGKNTGDLTPPAFDANNLALSAGTPADTALTATWTAIASQPGDPNGASEYLVYLSPANKDPCVEGVLQSPTVSALGYTAGQTVTYSVTGLQERTTYRVCVKARDLANNSSTNPFVPSTGQRNTLDITPPLFDGIQTFSSKTLAIGWNAVSPAKDVLEYRVKIWVTPSGSSVETGPTILTKAHSTTPTGFTLTPADVAYNQGDTVRVLVDACDNTAAPYGTQNCTALTRSLSVVVPDTTPPQGFLGVRPAAALSAPAQGQVLVKWFAPVDWSDYLGFHIYHVDTANGNALQPLKMGCECAAKNCVANPLTECLVTGLDAYRTYNFYVTAYDAAGNVLSTMDLPPASHKTAFRTTDTDAPVFSANATLSKLASTGPGTGGLRVQWGAALSDNQYAGEPGAQITYLVYRKQGSNFLAPAFPETDPGAILLTPQPGSTTRSYDDLVANPNGVTEGSTYFYVICARDSTGNPSCDGNNVVSRTVSDMTPPVLGTITSTKTNNSVKTWSLSWSIFDTITASGQIMVTVRRTITASATPPTTSDPVYQSAKGLASLTGETAPDGQEGYVNYRVTIADAAGNEAYDTISLSFDNKGPDKATGLNWNSGATGSASLTINAKWTRAAATLGILSDQIVNVYDVADSGGDTCSSTPVAAVSVGNSVETYGFAGTDLHAYRFKLDSVDNIGNHTLSDCSAKITISAAPTAAQSRVIVTPATVPANDTNTATVKVILNNLFSAPVAGKTVTLASIPARAGQDTINPPSATTNASGEATFTVSSAYVGTAVFTATDTTDNITVSEQGSVVFTVAPSLTNSTVVASDTTVVADGGTTSTITVTVKDSLGSPIPGRTLSMTSSRPTKDLIQALSGGVTDVNGVAKFKVKSTYDGASTYRVTVVEDSIQLTATAAVTYVVGPTTKLVFSVQPTNGRSVVTLSPAIKVVAMDDYGHVTPAALGTVTVSLQGSPAGVTLSGSKTISLSEGVAEFSDLSIDRIGTYNLVATSSALYTAATSAAFTITPGTPTHLVFQNSPGTTFGAHATIQSSTGSSLLVALLDGGGNIVTDTPVTISLSLTTPNGATLGGTTSRATGSDGAAAGTAFFDDLFVNKANTGYTLTASAAPYTSATSSAFNITPLSASKLGFSLNHNTGLNFCSTPYTVSVYDLYGNLTNVASGITVTLSKASGAGTLKFFASTDTTCSSQLSPAEITIPGGGSGASFRLQHNTIETIQIKADNGILTPVTVSSIIRPPLVFTHTGADQTWVVPNDGSVTTITVKAWGAGGGGTGTGAHGGGGGFVQGNLSVTPGETLTIIVGGGGQESGGAGFAGGGGRSAIRNGNSTELLTAGGGGGCSNSTTSYGGAGGYPNGGTGSWTAWAGSPAGATQSAPGDTGGMSAVGGGHFVGGYCDAGVSGIEGAYGGGGKAKTWGPMCVSGAGGWYGGGAVYGGYACVGGGSSHYDASATNVITANGSNNNSAQMGDTDYQAGVGMGGANGTGGNGLIVLYY